MRASGGPRWCRGRGGALVSLQRLHRKIEMAVRDQHRAPPAPSDLPADVRGRAPDAPPWAGLAGRRRRGILRDEGGEGSVMSDVRPVNVPPGREVATLAGGCFWCLEAVFDDLNGVDRVGSGSSGRGVPRPTYREVRAGATGHAEALRDPRDCGL